MKWIHVLIGIFFLLFAIVQWNDPDSLLWIILYTVIAVIAFLAFRDKYFLWPYTIFTAALLISLLTYAPDIMAWFNDGMPSITTSMKASSPYIELIREFFGLLISLIAMSYYLTLSKKNRS